MQLVGRSGHEIAERVPTVSFTVEGMKASEVPLRLEEEQIAARFGHFYAYRIIDRLGLMEQDGVVRVSLLHYNTPDEVTRLVSALGRIL